MSDRDDRLIRALNALTDVQTLLHGWRARLDQAGHDLSDKDRRDVMVAANALAKKASDALTEARDITRDVAVTDNLVALHGQERAAELLAIQKDVFREVGQ